MRINSIKIQYAVAAAGLFGIAFAAASLLSIRVVSDSNHAAQRAELTNASDQAIETMTALGGRISAYAKLMLSQSTFAQAILAGNRTTLETLAVSELKTLRNADPVMTTLELTDDKGIVIIRGHNPKTFGDNKASLKEVAAALEGKTTIGLAVSPTSGQAAFDTVAPVLAQGKVIGTLKLGAYATVKLAEEIKQKTGAEIVTIFRGKVTASTFPKDTKVDFTPQSLAAAVAGTPQILEVIVGDAPYLVQLRHLPSFAGEGIVLGTLVASEPFQAKTADFIRQIVTFGLLALPCVLVIGFGIGHVFGRPLTDTAAAMSGLAKGESASLARYDRNGSEIGDMARAFAHLRQETLNSFKLRQTVGGMPIGVMTIDRSQEWRIDYLNPTLTSLLVGHSSTGSQNDGSVAIGSKASTLLASAGIDDATLETLPATGRRAMLNRDDRQFALTLANIHAPDGSRLGAMVAWEDISERQDLARQFEATVKGVVDGVKRMTVELRQHANDVRHAATATLGQAEAVTRSSEENSASVTTVAAAAEELAASVNEIASQIDRSSTITHEAADQSRLMVDVVQELQEAANRIGTVVQLIGNIASQTNLLALNATIEAARAGEAGRGFAVVANEVKALAGQTARAADEVVAQVENIQTKTGEAVSAIDRINRIIGTVSTLSMSVAAAVAQQRNATGEIARNTQQTAAGTHEVAQSITEVSTATQQTHGASEAMVQQSDQLRSMIDSLNREVETFLMRLAA